MKANRFSIMDSIFLRMIILFILSLLPVYLLVLLFFNQGRAVLSKEITSSMQAEVSYYLAQFETELDRVRRLEVDLVNDEDLISLSGSREVMTDYEQTMALNRLQRRLSIIRSSSAYVDSISIHLFRMNRSLNSSRSGIGSISEIEASNRDSLMFNPVVFDGFLQYATDRISMRVGGSSDLVMDGSPLYTVEIYLSIPSIKAALARFSGPDRGSLVLFDHQGQFILSSGPDSGLIEATRRVADAGEFSDFSINAGGSRFLQVRTDSKSLRMGLIKYIPEQQAFSALRIYTVWYAVFTLVVVLLIFPFAFYSYTKVRKPFIEMMKSFARMEGGDLGVRMEHAQRDEFGYLSWGFNRMVGSLGTLIDQVAEQRNLAQKAELKQLQSQINPHFLYNSYFFLHRLIKQEDTKNASAFSRMMGKYFEYITRNGNEDASLSKEVEHARIYVDIQALRFEGRIAIEFGDLPACASGMMVPPLILQPIIENSFKHGLEDRQTEGLLKVSFLSDRNGREPVLLVRVEDNGESLDDAALASIRTSLSEGSSGTTGLINIHRRLALRFGATAGLRAERSDLGGLGLVMTLPLTCSGA